MLIRPATRSDAAAMAALQNVIITLGGTTAYQTCRTESEILEDYIEGPAALSCLVATDGGRLIGFQCVGTHEGLAPGWGDIGTFVAPALQAQGVGAALFAATLAAVRARGLVALNATIRADNVPGLAYYARIGFEDYADDPDWALDDGRRVGRISRRLLL